MCAAMTSTDARLLDELHLKQISRSIRDYIPKSASDDSDDETTAPLRHLLDNVIFTSSFPVLTVVHRTAAWNTLCSLIDQSSQSDLIAAKQVIWEHGVWSQALRLYLHHAHNARPKSSRQLLVTLTSALLKQTGASRARILDLTTKVLVSSLVDYKDPPRAKAGILLLTNFISKQLLDVQDLPSSFTSLRPGIRIYEGNLGGQDLLDVLLRWLGKGDFGSTIASSVSVVLDRLDEPHAGIADTSNNGREWQPWRTPLESVYRHGGVSLDDLRAHIFPMLFQRRPADFSILLHWYGIEIGTESSTRVVNFGPYSALLYSALQTGKAAGLLTETDGKTVTSVDSIVGIPISFIGTLMASSDRAARLAGLSLLLTSPAPSRPLSHSAIGLVKKALGVYFADVDADFRSEVFGAFQRLIDRLRAVTAVLARANAQTAELTATMEMAQATLRRHQDLLKWLLRFLAQELRPTASYQRHICALRCLSIFVRSGLDHAVATEYWSKSAQGQIKWPFELSTVSVELRRLLIDLLMDPFENVRQSSFQILTLYESPRNSANSPGATSTSTKPPRPDTFTNEVYLQALDRAEETMYQTGRADHADGVAHLYSLYYQSCITEQGGAWHHAEQLALNTRLLKKLELFVETAQKSLSNAVANFPLHGLLTSLRYLLIQRQPHIVKNQLHDEIPSILRSWLLQIWVLVKPILCDDAPEGYLPEELEASTNDTKETLSYCWRALKESSLLLGTLVSFAPTTIEGENADLEKYSTLCLTQLAQLRHRGAFSTVAQTWVACCMRAKDRERDGQPQLTIWYEEIMSMLRSNVTINTRRSAGFPSLLCGILVADNSGKLLARAVADLEIIARQDVDAKSAEEGSLAQVHAMNCFKDMLKNSRLGEHSEPFLPNALQLSADALRSDAWAIRNCGLMLFRAVIDRLLGTSDAHFDDDANVQKRISTEAYPQLLDVVLSLLKAPADGTITRFEGVFPALQLLQLTRVPNDRLSETTSAVEALTTSSSWHVRDKAARTLASFTSMDELALQLDELLSGGQLRENQTHGLLLLIKYTLAQARSDITQPRAPEHEITIAFYDCSCLARSVSELYHRTRSFVTKAASLDAIRACSAFLTGINTVTRADYDHAALLLTLAKPDSASGHAIEVFQAILDDHKEDPVAAVIRQAWARLVAQYLTAQPTAEHDSLSPFLAMIIDLSQHDEDAVVYFLEDLHRAEVHSGTPLSELMMELDTFTSEQKVGMQLKCTAQRTLIEDAGLPGNSVGNDAGSSHSYSADIGSTQHYVDQLLQIQTLNLNASSATQKPLSDFLVSSISAWADACVASVNRTGIHSREAGSSALGRVTTLWPILHTEPHLQNRFMHLCLAVYDLLNDDEEEIRLLASTTSARITAANDTAAEPIIAGQKLLAFCLKQFGNCSCDFITLALHRAFGDLSSSPPIQIESENDVTALFAQEKQNLYIDEAREVCVWSQVVLKGLSVIANPLIDRLAKWVNVNLDTLTSHAEKNHDGALGWSTGRPEIYLAGLKVIYGTEVLFSLGVEGSSELRKKLFEFVSAMVKAQVNCLWRWEAERVLTESLSRKILSVSGHISKGLEEHV